MVLMVLVRQLRVTLLCRKGVPIPLYKNMMLNRFLNIFFVCTVVLGEDNYHNKAHPPPPTPRLPLTYPLQELDYSCNGVPFLEHTDDLSPATPVDYECDAPVDLAG